MTQLEIGPIPWNRRMSEAAFLTVPYVPAEGPDPKASAVLIAMHHLPCGQLWMATGSDGEEWFGRLPQRL